MSDIHLEFDDFQMDRGLDEVLILAGDIGVVHLEKTLLQYIEFLEYCSANFKEVILVMGNHEHYHGYLPRTNQRLLAELDSKSIHNVYLLDNTTLPYLKEKIIFIGATLWTDGDFSNPMSKFDWNGMSDSYVIRSGVEGSSNDTNFTYDLMRREFQYSWQYLREHTLQYQKLGWKVVWINHHPITSLSIIEEYKGDSLNKFFSSPVKEYELLDLAPDLVIHGHTHTSFDYIFGDKTRIICNPRGYNPFAVNRNFNPNLTVEI
jgi:hypothetical protein